jgi:peptide-methionine (S)-S-oxide reductase
MMNSSLGIATLAGGCFWCLEAVYQRVRGVNQVVSGYTGGHVANPEYGRVTSGATGHAEAVQIEFDPAVVSYRDLLNIFFTIHDPTTLNRQGNDVGTQYRSAIFYHDEAQKAHAEAVMAEVTDASIWNNPLVTELNELGEFYAAEGYHQNYYVNNPNQPYCMIVVAPKVSKFKEKFAHLWVN